MHDLRHNYLNPSIVQLYKFNMESCGYHLMDRCLLKGPFPDDVTYNTVCLS